MPRQEFSRKVRRQAIERANGKCESKTCGAVLKRGEAEVDHILPCELGGEPVLTNAQVLCKICHKAKTAADVRRIRKSDRQRDKDSGAIRPDQSIQSAPFAKSEKAARRANKAPKPSLPPRPFYQERTNE
jgi:5-methylcytosine-specific restriction protein A